MTFCRSFFLHCVLCIFLLAGCSDKDTDPPTPPDEEKPPAASSWSSTKVSDGPAWDVQFVDNKTGFFVGSGVYKSADTGKTWTKINSPQLPNNLGLSYCHFLDESTGWVTQGRGNLVYFTDNGGQSWHQITVSGAINITQIRFMNKETGFVCAENGLFRTKDAGYNWELIIEDRYCTSFFALDDKTFWAGVSGGIFRTTDGENFTKTTVGTLFFAIQFFDNIHGLAINRTGELYQTSDGGLSWQQRLNVMLGQQATDLHFFDKDNGYIAGEIGVAKITGNKIVRVVTDHEAYLFEMFFIDPQHGFVGSGTGKLFRYVEPKQ